MYFFFYFPACKPSSTGSYILDNQKENYIVVHPDVLVTPTAISSSTKCLRRSILEKHFRTEGQKEVMFLGTLLHTIFDSALKSKGKKSICLFVPPYSLEVSF